MTSAAKPPLSPTCSTGPHERSEPAHHLRASLVNIVATEPGRRYAKRRSAIAPHLSAAMQIPQQHRRARPPGYQAPCPAWARLRQFPHRAANFGGFRNDGDDEKGTASKD